MSANMKLVQSAIDFMMTAHPKMYEMVKSVGWVIFNGYVYVINEYGFVSYRKKVSEWDWGKSGDEK